MRGSLVFLEPDEVSVTGVGLDLDGIEELEEIGESFETPAHLGDIDAVVDESDETWFGADAVPLDVQPSTTDSTGGVEVQADDSIQSLESDVERVADALLKNSPTSMRSWPVLTSSWRRPKRDAVPHGRLKTVVVRERRQNLRSLEGD